MGNAEKTVLLINPLWQGLDEPLSIWAWDTWLPACGAAASDGNIICP